MCNTIIFFISVFVGILIYFAVNVLSGKIRYERYEKAQRERFYKIETMKKMNEGEKMNIYNKNDYVDPIENEIFIIHSANQGTSSLRKCVVLEGKREMKAFFHLWAERSKIIPPSPMVGGHSGGVLKYTVAIVEFEDGSIREVLPEAIKFVMKRKNRPDCNNCKHLNITESEQKQNNIPHFCKEYQKFVRHRTINNVHSPVIYPCIECKKDSWEMFEEATK